MNHLKRLVRILWSWRLLVGLAPVCAALGALLVMLTFPPQYEATAKVELDIIKPDPVTGFHVHAKGVGAYITAQRQMIHDTQVTVRAASDLGWLDSPELQAQYATVGAAAQGVDFAPWVAARIGSGLLVSPVPESNILAIRFRAPSRDLARTVAEAVRNAYIEATLETTRQNAAGSAAAQAQQAEIARTRLAALEVQRTDFERASGIIIQTNNADTDTNLLDSMSATPMTSGPASVAVGISANANQLVQVESALDAAAKVYGPNNPIIIALRQRKAVLTAQVAQERAGAANTANAMMSAQRAQEGRIGEQMAKVIAQRPELTKLRLIQDQIDIWQQRYEMFSRGAQQQAQLSNVAATTVNPVGETDAPEQPVFPNRPLIMGGSLALGGAVGVLLALLAEMLHRRVRVASDLTGIVSTLVLSPMPLVKLPGETAEAPAARPAKIRAPKTRAPKTRAPKTPAPKTERRKWKLARA